MNTKSRKVIAVSQAVGGIFVVSTALLGQLWMAPLVPVWYRIIGLAVGLAAVVGGILLFLGKGLGKKLSIPIQAAQIVQISTTALLFKVIIGIQLGITVTFPRGLNISPGFYGSFGIWGPGHNNPVGIGINVFALWAFLLLLMSKEIQDTNRTS